MSDRSQTLPYTMDNNVRLNMIVPYHNLLPQINWKSPKQDTQTLYAVCMCIFAVIVNSINYLSVFCLWSLHVDCLVNDGLTIWTNGSFQSEESVYIYICIYVCMYVVTFELVLILTKLIRETWSL